VAEDQPLEIVVSVQVRAVVVVGGRADSRLGDPGVGAVPADVVPVLVLMDGVGAVLEVQVLHPPEAVQAGGVIAGIRERLGNVVAQRHTHPARGAHVVVRGQGSRALQNLGNAVQAAVDVAGFADVAEAQAARTGLRAGRVGHADQPVVAVSARALRACIPGVGDRGGSRGHRPAVGL